MKTAVVGIGVPPTAAFSLIIIKDIHSTLAPISTIF